MRLHVAAVLANKGGAIVVTEHLTVVPDLPGGRPERDAVVRGIERPTGGFRGMADRLVEIAHQAATDRPVFLIDAHAGGRALYEYLREERRQERFPSDRRPWPYDKAGRDRQQLVDALVVATNSDRVHFAGGLANQKELNRAMTQYRRQVDDDGLIGSELVIALALSLVYPRHGPEPRVIGRDGQTYDSMQSARLAGSSVAY